MKYLLLTTIFFCSPAYSGEISQTELGQLNALASNFDKATSKIEISQKTSGSCELNAAQSALEFKQHGMKAMESLFSQFSINDYKERGKNIYNLWESQRVLNLVKNLETRYPKLSDKRLYLLFSFCETKDKNIWFDTKNGSLSAARFFRSAFFASVLKNTGHDALELANAIDRETQRRAGY